MTQLPRNYHRFLLSVASLGPLGHLPASGTVTVAVVGIPLFYLLHTWSPAAYTAFMLAFTAAAVALHDWGDRVLGTKDSRILVWDEIAGFLVAVAFLPFTWRLAVIAFLVQRAIDVVKVPPAPWIEEHWPGGWGVVGDDLLAGAYAWTILHLLARFAPSVMGLTPP